MVPSCLDLTGAVPMPHILQCFHQFSFFMSLRSIFLSTLNDHLVHVSAVKPAAHSPYYPIPVAPIRPRLYIALAMDLTASR